jgi:dihydrofolate reductase/thymidylate synthase
MFISLIVAATIYKNKLAIGRNDKLLFRIKEDMKFFKEITTKIPTNSDPNVVNQKNIVLMGRKTYDSLHEENRPLKNRINIVLTRQKSLLESHPLPKYTDCPILDNDLYYTSFAKFNEFRRSMMESWNIFVIGGAEIYNYFLNKNNWQTSLQLQPAKIYLTIIKSDIIYDLNNEPNIFMDFPSNDFVLDEIGDVRNVTNITNSNNVEIRNLVYNSEFYQSYLKKTCVNSCAEKTYLDLMNRISKQGVDRQDRTNIGTLSEFGTQLKFDISNSIPLMTTKRVSFKIVMEELLWFCRGDTDASILNEKGVKIWNANTSREFLDKQGLSNYPEGVLGPGYGWQWRFFGAKYDHHLSNTSKLNKPMIQGGFDQLANVEHLLKTDPFSRRILISAWNPPDLSLAALPPCHILIQFYVEKIEDILHLSCLFYMRSNDLFLGFPINIASYSMLTYILAARCGMVPKDIIYTCGDTHVYKNHVVQVAEQVSRHPRVFPRIIIDPSVAKKEWNDIKFEDFELVGYFPQASIKAPMAV